MIEPNRLRSSALLLSWVLGCSAFCCSQSAKPSGSQPAGSKDTEALKQAFVAMLRDGDAQKFLSYIPADGVNVGSEPRHETREEVEQQLQHRRGLYCKLFDSSCLAEPIRLDASARSCSYREALTQSSNPRIAATETVRNGIRQAILVAQPDAKDCAGTKLIDFIFNHEHNGWKLFSVP